MFKTIKKLGSDESGVSPVIGVILMVAITVILAAVIAAFVLGFGADTSSAPQASWGTSENASYAGDGELVVFRHSGGQTIDNDSLSIGGDVTGVIVSATPDRISAGDRIYVNSTDSVSNGDEILLVWNDPDSDDTAVLASHTFRDQD